MKALPLTEVCFSCVPGEFGGPVMQAGQGVGFSFPVAALTEGSPHCPRWLPHAHHHMASSSPNKGLTKNMHTSPRSGVPAQSLVTWPLCVLLIWDGIAPGPAQVPSEEKLALGPPLGNWEDPL